MAGTRIPTLTLSNGASMPQLAFGTGSTWFEGDGNSPHAAAESSDSPLHRCVRAALDSGYRHLDCAEMYGTEIKVGQALARWLGETHSNRADVFVTSKVWRSCLDVGAACRASLERLGLEYLDLYLLHTPVSFMNFVPTGDKNATQQRVWRAMEQLVEDGLVKGIGVSNFSSKELETLLKYAKIKPVVNQVELHPHCQAGTGRDTSSLHTLCSEQGIVLEAYSLLAPLKSSAGPLHELVESMAAAKQITTAQLLLLWGVEHGAAIVTTSTNTDRIDEAKQIFDAGWSLTEDERSTLDTAGASRRERRVWAREFGDCYSD